MVPEDYAAGQSYQPSEDDAARAAEARLGSGWSYRKVRRAVPADGGGKWRRLIARSMQDGSAETIAGGRYQATRGIAGRRTEGVHRLAAVRDEVGSDEEDRERQKRAG